MAAMSDAPPLPAAGARPGLLALLSVAAAATVANLYYNQPLLASLGASFGATQAEIGRVPMLTQLGYGLGMLLLVPLGDRLERRRFIVIMVALAGLVLVGVSLAPSLGWFLALSGVLGMATMVPQLIVPYAATIAAPHERGRVVGTVMSGLLIGILLSRTVSGFVGERFGWRAMYAAAAGLMMIFAAALALVLPPQRPERVVPLRELYASLYTIARREPVLRLYSVLGALTFAGFSAFWSTLAFHLASLPGHYGSQVAGLFGLVGVSGALAAPIVGRINDRRDPRLVNGLAIATVLASFVVLGLFGGSLVGVGVGVVLLDIGAQANLITNQTRIFSLSPADRSRINTVYMSTYFSGGALGSWLGVLGWSRAGWTGVSLAGGALSALALAIFAVGSRPAVSASASAPTS
jgi:predicted MFS family arabinose efflux permease